MNKYFEIQQTLKQRLHAGFYPTSQPLPGELQLATEFGVSRMTLRRALLGLENEGYIRRLQGSGTFPIEKTFPQGEFRVQSLREWARGAEIKPQILQAKVVEATPELAIVLQTHAGNPLIHIQRLWFLGKEPLVLEKHHVLFEVAPLLLEQDLSVDSIDELLAKLPGIGLSRIEQTLETLNLGQEESHLLNVLSGSAAFLLRRIAMNHKKRCSYTNHWIRGDRYAFQDHFKV